MLSVHQFLIAHIGLLSFDSGKHSEIESNRTSKSIFTLYLLLCTLGNVSNR
jgi:hypothetical protein